MRSGATLVAVVMRSGECRPEAEETPMQVEQAGQVGPIETGGSKLNRAHPRPCSPQVAHHLARSSCRRRPLSLRQLPMSDTENRSAPGEDTMETRPGDPEVEDGKMPDKQASAALDDMVRRNPDSFSNYHIDP